MDEVEAVREANQRYYRAFESSDLDSMSAVWEHSARVVCTHPGWSTLRGWGQVASSYFALFQNGGHTQFVLTEERPEVGADTAWVSVDENLLGDDSGVTVACLNVFVRHEDGWRMVAHHGSVVHAATGGLAGA
ncbi:nuclear transport factor 2 family protein [Acidiferrimicrobium sp. IK]|uniref:nuclear transport factor 2 family protein n=1 Tax=Acidiferrimicrobium sp. IK TaxID=2871700 RepID=UPI0021CB0F5E|nr:nuclear transport factor 2 family protein [Acidiferrimicrobium sp. IK]MCU4184238.1 nuclear transport factor 2 family protein [Acidiferrimicrobium sp. IK]